MSDDEFITIRVGSNKSHTIRTFYGEVDRYYTHGPDEHLPSESDEGDENSDLQTDSGGEASLDAGEVDVDTDGDADNRREGDLDVDPDRGETDEGASVDTADTSEQASGSDEREVTDERTEPESQGGSAEYEHSGFHFAPGLHSRGIDFS